MSHADTIKNLPSNFDKIASTSDVENAAFHVIQTNIYGLQFHPESINTKVGMEIIKNYINL